MVRAGKTVVVKCTSHPSSQIFVTVVISFRPTCIHVPRSLPSINQDEQIALSSPQLNQGRRPALSLPTSFWGTQGGGEAMHTRTRAHAARCTHRVQEKIGLEARSVAFVAQTHRLQVTILDERPLVGTAVSAHRRHASPRWRACSGTHAQQAGG